MAGIEVQVSISKPLYQRLEQAARLAHCAVQDIIMSALESALPVLPDHLQLEDAADLARLALLDDETLRALAATFLPRPQQRRFTTLLRKEEAGRLRVSELFHFVGKTAYRNGGQRAGEIPRGAGADQASLMGSGGGTGDCHGACLYGGL